MNDIQLSRYVAYKEVLDIDLYTNLDEAYHRHDASYFDVADECSEWERILDLVQIELEEALASAEIKIREELKDTGERVTDRAVSARIELDSEVQRLKRKYFETKADTRKWKVLYDAYRSRGFKLNKLMDVEREKIRASGGMYQSNEVTAAEIAHRNSRRG